MNRKQRRARAKAPLVSPAEKPSVQSLFDEALRHHQVGRLPEAERLYRLILNADPSHADSLHLLGVSALQAGRHDLAAELIGQAIRVGGAVPAYHSNHGMALKGLGRLSDALAAYETAIGIQPDFATAHSNRSNLLIELGRLDDALAACDAAIRIDPGYAKAHCNRANILRTLGRPDESLAACDAAIRIDPNYPEAHSNRGNALADLGRLDKAIAAYDVAIRINPNYVKAHSNRGNALKDLGRLDDADAAYAAAIRIAPDFAEAHSNRGVVLAMLGRLDDAVAAYDAAIRLIPAFATAHYNRGHALLTTGAWAEGWPEFEWRLRGGSSTQVMRDFPQPQWQGERLDGRTILLHAEQGLGDTLQFCRYIPRVAAEGGRLVLEAPQPLVRLLAGLGADEIVATGEPLPPFDVHRPLMSLPAIFGTTMETVPAGVPYLQADPDRVAFWRKHLSGEGFRVGIVWQGNPTHANDRERSISLTALAALGRLPGVRLVSLQRGYGVEQLDRLPAGMGVERLGHDFDTGDLAETAAVVSCLDLVVTIDSAIAHLAGALGRPVWVPLCKAPDWRWMLDRSDSPWYPTMRLFRQHNRGDWPQVFASMAAALTERLDFATVG